jgi:hypothetical protein
VRVTLQSADIQHGSVGGLDHADGGARLLELDMMGGEVEAVTLAVVVVDCLASAGVTRRFAPDAGGKFAVLEPDP